MLVVVEMSVQDGACTNGFVSASSDVVAAGAAENDVESAMASKAEY
jgi:hypothetical protein